MGVFDRRTDAEKQAIRDLRNDHKAEARARANEDYERERRRLADERRRLDDAERLRQLDMRDGRFDGRI